MLTLRTIDNGLIYVPNGRFWPIAPYLRYLGLLCFVLLAGYQRLQAQDLSAGEKAARKSADRYYSGKNYYMALEGYLPILKAHPEDVDLNFVVGMCYQQGWDKEKALGYLAKAALGSPKPTKELMFAYGSALHFDNQFDEAIKWYRKADPLGTNRYITSKRINECLHGKRLVATPVKAIISNLGNVINTAYNEYLPLLTADQLTMVFTSRRPNTTGGKKDADGQFLEDIYISKMANGSWSRPQALPEPLNSRDHDACVGLSADGQTMFIYKGKNGGDIYISKLDGKTWGTPQPFEFNSDKFESSAFLSHDGNRLYFVSDRAGNKDIYICRKTFKGAWGKPSYMNQNINTSFDEESPCESADGKWLYFSSKGATSMGGYDILRVPISSAGATGMSENLGYPINTAGDDLYFNLSPDGKFGYFSSEKAGGYGRQDLYVISMPPPAQPPGVTLVRGVIKDAATGKPTQATVIITDNEAGKEVATLTSNSVTGEFSISLPSGNNYGIAVEKSKRLFYSENLQIKVSEGFVDLKRDIVLPTIAKGNKMILRNMFYDNNISDLRSASFPELNRVVALLKAEPTMVVEVGGHTDNVGTADYNQKLSLKRATDVINYLVKNGIAAKRLIPKGYASSQPIAPNTTEDGRLQNRRTEIMVLKE